LTVPTFDEFFSIERLDQNVEDLLNGHFDVIEERPRISIGSDRIDLDLFLRDRAKHLAAISRKVIGGRYTFSPFMEHEIPKADSTVMRTISIASIRDSIVQRAIYQYSYDAVDRQLTPAVFGYRRGRSAHSAIRSLVHHVVAGRTFIFDADLSSFFDSVDHDVLLGKVDRLHIDSRAITLIRRFLKTGRIPSAQVQEHKERRGKQLKFSPLARTIGVPQGGVLSGLLSNLYLADFDAGIISTFEGYIRYADDFVICTSSADECRAAQGLVEEQLLPIRVLLNAAKTKLCVLADCGVDFLGFRVSTRGVRVRSRNVGKFKVRILKMLEKQRIHKRPSQTLRALAWRLQFKIRGPDKDQVRKLAERGRPIHPYRRSWIGYFRIVDDLSQIRRLDRWIRKQVSKFMWESHKVRVNLKQMQEAGLPSLVNCLWKARSEQTTEYVE